MFKFNKIYLLCRISKASQTCQASILEAYAVHHVAHSEAANAVLHLIELQDLNNLETLLVSCLLDLIKKNLRFTHFFPSPKSHFTSLLIISIEGN